MLSCGRSWQPTTVNRVIELFGSSTRVARVATDEGICFLKGMGNPAGNESLAQELVGSELASAIGLRVPPFAIVDIADIEIALDSGRILDFGPAFVSSELVGHPAAPGITFIKKLINQEHIPLLVAFDTWIRNADRCPPSDALDPTPNWDNLFFRPIRGRFEMVVFDHTHCFVEVDLETELEGTDFVEDDRVYGAFPEFAPFLNEDNLKAACSLIAKIDGAVVREIVHSIPRQWGPTTFVRERWINQIVARSGRIEEYVLRRLVDQGQLRV